MSRIGKKVIKVPAGVTISLDGGAVTVKGPKGELKALIARELTVEQENGELSISRPNDQSRIRSQHGLARTLIFNMVEGVTGGHKKTLEIFGVGYRAQMDGKNLLLNMGYSHPVKIEAPTGIDFEVVAGEKNKAAQVVVKGIDKALVGQLAADIRKVRKPDPYKGKGLRYQGEVVKLRPGKRAGK